MANEIAAVPPEPRRPPAPRADARRWSTDALDRLLLPSLEREVRRDLTERAEDHAVVVFASNLRSLLLQPPLRGKKVLAIDPGFRTGCKLAVLDETGNLLEDAVDLPARPEEERRPRPSGSSSSWSASTRCRSSPSATAPAAARPSSWSPT